MGNIVIEAAAAGHNSTRQKLLFQLIKVYSLCSISIVCVYCVVHNSMQHSFVCVRFLEGDIVVTANEDNDNDIAIHALSNAVCAALHRRDYHRTHTHIASVVARSS